MRTTLQDQDLIDVLNEVTDSLMRLYVQHKHLFGSEDRHGSLNEIMNIAYRIHSAQQKLVLKRKMSGEGPTNSAIAACETL